MNLKTLERKLSDNYDGINDESVTKDVFWFMYTYPDPNLLTNSSVLFIKKMGKVFTHMIERGTDFSREQLLWIMNYNQQGIDKIVKGEYNKRSRGPEEMKKIHSHFYGHNARVKTCISETTTTDGTKLHWLKKAYFDLEKALQLSKDCDPNYCASRYFQKGDLAEKISGVDHQKKLWLERALGNYKKAVTKLESFDIFSAACACEKVGDLVPTKKEKVSWWKKGYFLVSRGKLTRDDNEHFQKNRNFMAYVARNIAYVLDGEEDRNYKILWLKKAYLDYGRSIRTSGKNISKKNLAYKYTLKGDLAEQLADLMTDESQIKFWWEQAYQNNIIGLKKIKKLDKKHSAITSVNAGKDAYNLFKITKDEFWKKKSISSYSTFLNYYKGLKDVDLKSLSVKVEIIVNELKGIRKKGKKEIRIRGKSKKNRIVGEKKLEEWEERSREKKKDSKRLRKR